MSFYFEALTGLCGSVGATAVIATVDTLRNWMSFRRSRSAQSANPAASLEEPGTYRCYTLLRTVGRDGVPVQYETTRPSGSVIIHRVDGRSLRFQLTDAPLGDGTYAAEPLDHL